MNSLIHATGLLLVLIAGYAPRVAAQAAAGDTAPADTAVQVTAITFISGAQIFIGAGRLDGLVEGSQVTVVHGDVEVAVLRVQFVSSHRAACEWVKGSNDLALGDVVRFSRQTRSSATVPTRPRRPRRLSGPGLHGRFGSRYVRANTTATGVIPAAPGSALDQVAADARIIGTGIGGTPLGMMLDLRVRQTTTNAAGISRVDGKTRVYQAAVQWNAPTAGFHLAAGRQYVPAVTSLGLLDGGFLALQGRHVTFGTFAGFEPDLATLDFSDSVRDAGTYLAFHSAPTARSSFALTVGAVGSYEGGRQRREWGIAQLSINNRYLALYLVQEVDYFRPWKRQGPNAEAHPFSGTSRFASLSLRAARWIAFNGTYDKRRNVPTIRDFTNAETTFDDAYREGYGGGLQLTGRKVYAAGDWHRSTGAGIGQANTYTASGGWNRLTPLHLGLAGRITWYRNETPAAADTLGVTATSGTLFSGRLSVEPVTVLHLEFHAGRRLERTPLLTGRQRSTWYGADLDWSLARTWFASFSGFVQKDPLHPGTSKLTQVSGGLTWRF